MRITIDSGAAAGREFDVLRQMTVGRSASSDIHLPDAGISSRHATVRPIAGGIEVTDLGSTNGTFVNDVEVHSARAVYPGDTLRFSGVVAAVRDVVATEVVVAPGYPANAPPAAAATGSPGRRLPLTAMLAAGVVAAVLAGAAYALTRGSKDGNTTAANASPPATSTQPPTPLRVNPTQPPAPAPTQPPAPSPNPTAAGSEPHDTTINWR